MTGQPYWLGLTIFALVVLFYAPRKQGAFQRRS